MLRRSPPWRVCCLTSGTSTGLDRKLRSNPGGLGRPTTGTQHRKASSQAGPEARGSTRWSLSLSRTGLPAGSVLRLTSEGVLVGRPRDGDLPSELPKDPCRGPTAHRALPPPKQPLPRLGPWLPCLQSTPGSMCVRYRWPRHCCVTNSTRSWPGSPHVWARPDRLGCLSP